MNPGKSKRGCVRNVRNVPLLSCILYTRHSAITRPQVFSLMLVFDKVHNIQRQADCFPHRLSFALHSPVLTSLQQSAGRLAIK